MVLQRLVGIVAGIGVIVTCLYVIYHFGVDITLSCSIANSSCSVETVNVFGQRKQEASINLASLKGADIETTYSRSRGGSTYPIYRVVLITDQGKIPFSRAASTDLEPQKAKVNQINQYINSEEESLKIVESGSFQILCSIALILLGAFVIFANVKWG